MSKLKQLYLEGNSAQEIKDKLNLDITVRSIQRQIKKLGISRTVGESFRLAASKGRIRWAKKESTVKRLKLKPGLRYSILKRDNFKCTSCGNDATKTILEVDHIDNNPSNNNIDNLTTLCEWCNLGKQQEKKYMS